MNSTMFRFDMKDVSKGLVTAGIVGFFLPILVMFQTPGFDIFNADWHSVLVIALNGALAGFAGYLAKNF